MADTAPPRLSRTDLVANALGHVVADVALLEQACTHTSRLGAQASAADKRARANERLEFLGDAILGAALADLLYAAHPDADEGDLSRLKSNLASRATLARCCDDLGLAAIGIVGEQMPAPWPDSVKANLVEALLAAVYLDAGWSAARTAVGRLMGPLLADPAQAIQDPRQRLQEWSLAQHQRLPSYDCARSGGTDHAPEFSATVSIGGLTAEARGTSRRRAESAAAQALLTQVATADQPTR